ncbi:MAG TPA: cobaltochelatase subunit CobN, partial [Chthoniobacterales bacterium]|nr:cobaltochelatase subunit CobN [Chthoniobacterales bacterium]
MHWTAAQPGCVDAERELILVEQTPGEIVFLSAADSDLAAAAHAWRERFGVRLRVAHAAPLRQPVAADHYIENVVRHARLVIARLLGGSAYFPHLMQALSDLKDEPSRPLLLLLSGTDQQEEELTVLSDFAPAVCARMFEFFKQGSAENLTRAGDAIERLLREDGELPEPVAVPAFGVYRQSTRRGTQHAWLCFYRAWHQTSDVAVVDALCDSLESRGFSVVCFYAFSLREPESQRELLRLADETAPDVILTMQSFAVCLNTDERLSFFEQLGCPVLQVSVSSSTQETWLQNPAGIAPAEVAMNVALPEIDGRVFGTVVGFKENDEAIVESEFTAKRLQPEYAQARFVAELAANWARLRRLANAEKKIAIVLSNYPNRNGRIGNGVGLDTPASAINLLTALRAHGYRVEPLPESGEQLMAWLQEGVTNDPEQSFGRCADAALDRARLLDFLAQLPERRRDELRKHWPADLEDQIPIPGKWLGNIFVGIQPPRGFSLQTQAIYHSPQLPPPPQYLAFYLWLREQFGAHAFVHFGKHGNLEWLPGRSLALGQDDYPQLCLGPTPSIYPFIVNNPGEGAQAKRRISAVIVDHLTPPLAPAGLYDDLEKMERLLEEHAHASTLYPARAAELEGEIQKLLATVSWREELPAPTIEALAGYLCEIKESQIRSGLHILGEKPSGEREIEFLVSLLRASAPEFGGMGDHATQMEWVRSACTEAELAGENEERRRLRKRVRQQLRPRLALCRNEIDHIIAALDGRFVSPGPAGA